MVTQRSVASRALLALALTIGFYLMAILLALLLFAAGLLALRAGGIGIKLTLFAWAAAGTIAWAVLPRSIPFEPPGPQITADEHPGLFNEINLVAQRVNQRPPDTVYLLPDMNAFVAEPTTTIGAGKQRIMGIGLPLLQCNSITQLRAVLTHEFGHYHYGDTKLGPWIYSTRAALGRTISALAQKKSIFQYPFISYGKTFMKLTQEVSRHQEFVADQLAARTFGAEALGSSLTNIRVMSAAYSEYWSRMVSPVLDTGHYPPIMAGFSQFLSAEGSAGRMSKTLQQAVNDEPADQYDSHPSLSERLKAIGFQDAFKVAPVDQPAITLLGSLDETESKLLGFLCEGNGDTREFKSISWDEVGPRLYPLIWQKRLVHCADLFAGITPRSMPGHLTSPYTLGHLIAQRLGVGVSENEIKSFTEYFLAIAISFQMTRQSWTADAKPGRWIYLTKGDEKVAVRNELSKLAAGVTTSDDWQTLIDNWGISTIDLGAGLSVPDTGQLPKTAV